MAKDRSKTRPEKTAKTEEAKKQPGIFKLTFREKFQKTRGKVWNKKSARFRLHRSFRRSYREDYARRLEVPGLLSHAIQTFQTLFRNWRIFTPFILLIVILNILLVGLMSEETYEQFQDAIDSTNASTGVGEIGKFARAGLLLLSTVTTGGLSQGMTEVQQVFAVLFFIIIWLVTIYLLRHLLAGNRPRLRDGLYNALAPFLSTFCVFAVLLVQAVPIFIVIVTYSAAVATDFLATPFYALVYFIFASLLLLLSGYLISSSFLALVAVSAPGLYPMAALNTASDLVMGRRVKLIIRLIYLILVVGFIFVVTMLPLILLDMWLKSIIEWQWFQDFPFVSLELLIVTVYVLIYATAYCYLFYRRMLDYDE